MILLFGKTGQVAKEMQTLRNVHALGRQDVDLLNPLACAKAISKFSPSVVINTAAYTAVDKAEKEESLATIINGDAPTEMANTCAKHNIPFINISTDYVFDGSQKTPRKPTDMTNPINAYGRSKLAGEIGIRKSGANHVILRTSWVVSAHGKNFVKTILRLSETKSSLNIVGDQIGGPTPANDIASTCLLIAEQLAESPSKSGTYHFSGMPNVSWANFAKEILKQAGKNVVVSSILTADYKTSATRPLNSKMDCSEIEKVFGIRRKNWKIGLNVILKDLGVFK